MRKSLGCIFGRALLASAAAIPLAVAPAQSRPEAGIPYLSASDVLNQPEVLDFSQLSGPGPVLDAPRQPQVREPVLFQRPLGAGVQDAPHGPGDIAGAKVPGPRILTEADSALVAGLNVPVGGFPHMQPGIAPAPVNPAGVGDLGGGGQRNDLDQPLQCDGGGWYSNNNSNRSPYLVFEDFVCPDNRPLDQIVFYGDTYNPSTGQSCDLANLGRIGIEIWTIQGGGACGWQYNSFVWAASYTPGELSPQYVCDGAFGERHYQFTANVASPPSLTPGVNYMITIYGTLNNPDDPCVFFWSTSSAANFNASSSWDRADGSYDRCGPDVALRLVPEEQDTYCQENDCQTTCYFSNLNSNLNPFIALDDWVATTTSSIEQIRFTGGGYDLNTGTGCDFSNIASFYIEIYEADAAGDCGWFVSNFLGAFEVPIGNAGRKFDCTDIFGIDHYEFTVNVPSGFYQNAGQRYALGVYAVLRNPDNSCIFCWGGTSDIIECISFSFNLSDGSQSCHDVDQAFCIVSDSEKYCQDPDCNQTCYFSNLNNNNNTYLRYEDFVCQRTGTISQIDFVGGGYDLNSGTGCGIGGFSDFVIEIYEMRGGGACGWQPGRRICSNRVSLADLNPQFVCTDIFGINHYRFTADLSNCFQFEGRRYALLVAAVSANPNDTCIFCWRCTGQVYGAGAYSINRDGNTDCGGPDQAFCLLTDDRPGCYADFNQDGVVDTRDVLAFLNSWTAGTPDADCNRDNVIDTRDVLCFLNLWTAGC